MEVLRTAEETETQEELAAAGERISGLNIDTEDDTAAEEDKDEGWQRRRATIQLSKGWLLIQLLTPHMHRLPTLSPPARLIQLQPR